MGLSRQQCRDDPGHDRHENRYAHSVLMIHRSGTLALLAIALAAWWLTGCGSDAEAARPAASTQPAAVSVRAARPERLPITRTIRATGSFLGDEESTLAAKVPGRVLDTFADLGDTVAPNTPLAQIDPVDFELALQERKRAFEQALAKLGLSEMPSEEFDIDRVPSVQRSLLQEANAKSRYERGRLLMEKQPPLISAQDFDDLKTAWDVAESDLRVERLTAGTILAEARTLQSQIRIAEQRLNDTLLRAPATDESATWSIAQRFVSAGDYVQIGDPLFRLVDSDPIRLRVTVPERRLAEIAVGQSALAHVEAFENPFRGSVSRISPAIDPSTRTFLVEIRLENPDGAMKVGSFASADIEIGQDEAITIPASSLINFAGVRKVVLVRDGKAEERRVTPGVQIGDRLEILSGLTEQDSVVLDPPGSLVTGTPVTVAAESAP